ncbi:MAG: T9SS type A sorting domain-containing protein [Chitinophagaceae bacterium]|nr:T9SS type A sorting domain-containing protein [Chitinophagaceae bacterium]
MPQFNPSAGTLVCVKARVWLTSVVRLRLENEDNVTISYVVHYLRDDVFSGPGISPNVTGSRNKDYGPYVLAPANGTTGSGPDYQFIGPDSVYNKLLYEVTTSNVVNYLGTGTVNFQYKSTVPTYATGSDFYTLTVNSVNKLDFDLTYSYCANSVLATNIKNFSASLIDKSNVSLEWTTVNESKNNIYEIEVSENGKQFENAGTIRAKPVNGTAAKYFYQYHSDQPAAGKLYFRLKQSAAGSARYSEIKSVTLSDEPLSLEKLSIYPNPVIRNLVLDFNTPVSGDYQVQLTNQVGQVVYVTRVKMNNSNTLQLQLNDPPVPGIYYIRAVNTSTNKALSGKVLFAK